MFQTGRLNVRLALASLPPAPPAAGQVMSLQQPPSAPKSATEEMQVAEVREAPASPIAKIVQDMFVLYGSVVLFVVADSSRTMAQQQSLSKVMITPQSMVLTTYLGGMAVATLLVIQSGFTSGEGWLDSLEGLRLAWDVRKILRYVPCAAFFAMASTLLSTAYTLGISPALATCLGYIYMPVSAMGSALVLGKYYLWLEWFGLVILTCASSVFGLLENYFLSQEGKAVGGQHMLAMLLVVMSAMSSVVGSLLAEKLLKAEQLPFFIQKVRLDVASALASLAVFPALGVISTRPQDAFWKQRPLSKSCDCAVCWSALANETCRSPSCTCPCGSGVFVAWDNWVVVLALTINVLQSWMVGKVIKNFSTVTRAMAQSSSILVIYFIGDPLLNPNNVHRLTLDMVAFLVPLSTTLFMVSVSAMEKVMAKAAPFVSESS